MEPLELKIFGHTFQINAPKDKHQFYRSIAEKLNDMMVEESTKSDVKSDSKTAIKVAFLLAVEGNNSKKQLQDMEKIVSDIEANIASLQTT